MGTARNFTVKTGLDIDDGDLTLTDGDILLTAGFLLSTPATGNPLKIDGSTISTLSGDHDINITPNGTGSVVIDTADIDGGTIDAADITVGSGKTLDVSGGTLTLAADQISGDAINGGTIGSITITALAGALSLGDNNITNVGDLNADSISVDAAGTGLNIDFSGADTTKSKITLKDNLADALNITEGSNSYMKFRTTNGSEMIELFKDLEFDKGSNHLISIEGTGTNTEGKTLTVRGGLGDGTSGGGTVVIQGGGVATGSGQGATTAVTGLTVSSAGQVVMGSVDINGGAIDGTTIGSAAQAAAKFTTLDTTGHATINGSAKETTSNVQINGGSRTGTANSDTGNMYSELRLYSDIANDDLGGVWNGYYGMSNSVILENAEDVTTSGQAVVFSVGTGADTGSTFAAGRMSGTADIFTIGYFADNYDQIGYANASNNDQDAENPMLLANSIFNVQPNGVVTIHKNNGQLGFTSNTDKVTAIKGSPSASASATYTLPVAAPNADKVLQSTSAGVLSWVTGAAGGDANQTLTTGGGISGANGGSTGNFTIAVEAAQTTITSIHATDLIIGEDAQTAIDFGTADEIDFKAANAVQLTLADGVFRPETDSDVDFGTTDIRWKNAFVDTLTTTDDVAVGDDMTLLSDNAILGFGADTDVTLTHIPDTGIRLNAGMQLQFRNANQNIYGDASQLNLRSNAIIDLTAQAVNMTASTAVAMTTPEVVISSATSAKPTLTIQNTHNGTTGGELRFKSDDGAAGADGDDIGTISFYADDSGQNQTAFASIVAEVSESADTDEAGKLTFFIAESDGTNTAQTAALILEGEHATNGQVDVTIGAGALSTTTIVGDLVVNGATTTISTAQLTVEDDLITISKGNDSTANANASGVEIDVDTDGAGTGTNIAWIYNHATTAWQSNVDIDTSGTGNTYKINGTEVLNSNTLGSGILASSLTSTGALNGGSITSGFGTIDTGASTITTTGLISGGSLDIDDVLIDGATIGHTNDADLITLANGLVTVAGEISVTTLDIGGTNVTSTAAELNYLDLTASIGTVTASEALVVDASRNLTNINNVTSTGALQGATLSVDAVAILDTARGAAATINGATNLFSIPKATYKAAKLIYHIKKDDNNRTDAGEILVTHDGTNAFLTHYGQVNTDLNAVVGTWDCTVNSANIEVRFTPTANGAHTYGITATQMVV
ncbi:hypothetical protein N9246_01140 [bacterium]|nr:hypothetical protein [bacterium]